MRNEDLETLKALRSETARTLSKFISPAQPVAILDLPNHGNVGDQLIAAGERYYMRRLGLSVVYQSDKRRFNPADLRQKMPNGTILVHGGGNVGDLWKEHQQFRERLAECFPDYPIVQLPQSVYFRDSSNAAQANRSLASHPNLTLLVREYDSFERAETQLPDVNKAFAPDMAFGWTNDRSRDRGTQSISALVLSRRDQEKSGSLETMATPLLGTLAHVSDWRRDRWSTAQYYSAQVPGELSRHIHLSFGRSLLEPARNGALRFVSDLFVRSGVKQFLPHDLIITDRLHAQILATLLGIPNIAMDNEYGKISSVFSAYTHRFSTAHFAKNQAELEDFIANLWGSQSDTTS